MSYPHSDDGINRATPTAFSEFELSEFAEGDVIYVLYQTSETGTTSQRRENGEIIDVFPGSPHRPPSITIRTDDGETRTIQDKEVKSQGRGSPHGRRIGFSPQTKHISYAERDQTATTAPAHPED